jgi:hypothetical protein
VATKSKKVAKLLGAAVVAWLSGLGVILAVLYFGNGGADFTMTDFMGFGVIFTIASILLTLIVYLPGLLWLRKKSPKPIWFPLFTAILLNLPIFILLALLVGKKTSLLESIGFMLTFLVAGCLFGLGFLLAGFPNRQA